MPFTIGFTDDAERHLDKLRSRDRRVVVDEIEAQLVHEPTVITRNRKPLKANSFAQWELRVQKFRVLYNVDEEATLVEIVAIGEKVRSVLLIEGKEFKLR
jgi:mRNA-degrading endonuclease RelE of RelBE toxin-antitoxin system